MSLQLQCPACGTGFDLREARNDQEWREFCTLLTQFPQAVQSPLLQYLELFKPAKHPLLRSGTMLKLAGELLPMVKAQEVNRKHNTYTVTHAVWAGAMTHLSNTRASLILPLKSNGYLLETLANRQEKLAGKQEQQAIVEKRQQPIIGAKAEPEFTAAQRSANLRRLSEMLSGAPTAQQEEQS